MKETPILDDQQGRKLQQKLVWGRSVFALSYLGLLGLFALLNLVRESGSWQLWLVQTLPLAIFIPGLLRQRYRTYSWICFAVLMYFTWSVTNAMAPWARWWDLLIVLLTVSIFISAMMVSRWLQYYGLYLFQATERQTSAATETPNTTD